MFESTSRRIPSYRKHKATGRARVTLNGKTYYLGQYGSSESKSNYNRLIQEWLAAGRQPTPRKNSLTVAELILAYCRTIETQLQGGRKHNLRDALRIIKEIYGACPVEEFGPKALKVARERMRNKDWSRSYINRQIAWVRRMFRWGAEEELVSGNQFHSLVSVPGIRKGTVGYRESKSVKPVASADVEATIHHLPAAVATMVRVQLLTGCRPGEVCRLLASNLDMSKPDLWKYKLVEHKEAHLGKDRVIFFGPKAIEFVRPWLRADGKYLFSPAESEEARNAEKRKARQTPMTPSQAKRKRKKNRARPWGDRYTSITYRRAIHRACKKARIALWSPNQLRHTRASEIRRQFGLEAAQVYLGHATANVTQIYAERDCRLGEEVARQIG